MRKLRAGAVLVGMALVVLGIGVAAHVYAAPGAAPFLSTPQKTVKAVDTSTSFAFSPLKATVKVGTKITWKNVSQAPHTVTSKTHGWKYDKPLDQGKSVSLVFHKAGTYTYYCKIHPDMVAKIIVKK